MDKNLKVILSTVKWGDTMAGIKLEHIMRATLPPELLFDNFIDGIESTHEAYLTEFVNASDYFMELSKGTKFVHIPKEKQNAGECDCVLENYALDFKRFGTQSSLYAKSNLSWQKASPCPGIVMYAKPKQLKGMPVTLINNLFNDLDVNDLVKIDKMPHSKFKRDEVDRNSEIKFVLETLKCKKNIMFFCTDFIYSDIPCEDEPLLKSVQEYIRKQFSKLFLFRDCMVPEKDSYFAIIIQGYFCLAKWESSDMKFLDTIPLSTSPTFCELYEMIDQIYKERLILK